MSRGGSSETGRRAHVVDLGEGVEELPTALCHLAVDLLPQSTALECPSDPLGLLCRPHLDLGRLVISLVVGRFRAFELTECV